MTGFAADAHFVRRAVVERDWRDEVNVIGVVVELDGERRDVGRRAEPDVPKHRSHTLGALGDDGGVLGDAGGQRERDGKVTFADAAQISAALRSQLASERGFTTGAACATIDTRACLSACSTR